MGRKNFDFGSQNTAWDYSFNNATLAVTPGRVVDCGDVFSLANMQLSFGSAPTSVSVNLEGSLDGTTWTVLQTSTATTTNTINSAGIQFRLLRANVTASSGGTTVTAIVTAQPGATLGGSATQSVLKLFRDSAVTINKTGSVTAPGAGSSIATATIVNAGMYEITFTYFLSGTVTSADANNFRLEQNTTVRFSALPYPAVTDTILPAQTVVLSCAAGDTVSVQNPAAGSAAAVYNATIVARQVG